MGVTGQQQQASKVSADDAILGGAGGFFCSISRGGATKPASPVPSPEISVPVQSVLARAAVITFLVAAFISVICKIQIERFDGTGLDVSGDRYLVWWDKRQCVPQVAKGSLLPQCVMLSV